MTNANFSRRDLFKLGGIAAATVAATGALAGCGAARAVRSKETEAGAAAVAAGGNGPSFLVAPEPITEFAETHDYDVVVVGAGESGVSAVYSALNAGARVACVQNAGAAQSTGNMAACIDLTKTSEAAIQACISFINWKSDYRQRSGDLVDIWARNSQEAIGWWAETAAKGGVEAKYHDAVLPYNGYEIYLHANTYFHTDGHNASVVAIAEQLEQQGADFYYIMPCVQLQTADDGSVTGAICKAENGDYHLFTATKGVILATGDYSSNAEMIDYYAPDCKGFRMFTDFRDGSGLVAGMNAGAIMTPPPIPR